MNAIAEQKRTDVRSDLSFEVNYQILTPEEYTARKGTREPIITQDQQEVRIGALGTDSNGNDIMPNPWVADFLVQMDEKLNHIISLLSEKALDKRVPNRGIGLNISGSGMRMRVDQAVEAGQIVQTDFLLSKFPYVQVNLFGRVIRVTPSEDKDRVTYDLGIHFLDPDERAIERIIAKVFQLQRTAIRNNRKNT